MESSQGHAYSPVGALKGERDQMPKFPDLRIRSLHAITAAILLTGALANAMTLASVPSARAATIPRHPAHSRHHPRPAYRVHWIIPRHPEKPPRLSPLQLARRGRWRLDIPGIGVASRLLTFGAPDGRVLPVPSLAQASKAAWYDFSAIPGTPGNAVLVGHVDTYTGPAVFYDLYLLRPGDPIYVSIGARRLRFAVQRVAEVSKPQFPARQIFGGTTARRLWIITCGGPFDYLTRHYLDNIIVSASFQPARRRQHR